VHDGDSDLYNSDSDNDEVSTKQQEGLPMPEGAGDGTGGDTEAKTRDDKPGSNGEDEEDEDADVDPKELKRWHQLKAEEAVCDGRKVSHVLRCRVDFSPKFSTMNPNPKVQVQVHARG